MKTREAARQESKCLDIPSFLTVGTLSCTQHLKFMREAGPHVLLDGQAGNGKEGKPTSGRRAMAPGVGVGSSALSTEGDALLGLASRWVSFFPP